VLPRDRDFGRKNTTGAEKIVGGPGISGAELNDRSIKKGPQRGLEFGFVLSI
jgi:hypothetical protein